MFISCNPDILLQRIYPSERIKEPVCVCVCVCIHTHIYEVIIALSQLRFYSNFNSINRKDNYFTINRGKIHGVMPKMGVIAPQGIAGIVINTTDEYALVQSVLSVNKMRINAALKNAGYFGTLTWKGDNARIMHLADVPKYVPIAVGDTVITDGKSAIFPKGVMIGRVAGYEVDTKTGYWDISVELSEKMGNIRKVYVVTNLKKEKIQKIQDTLKASIKRENDE